MHQTLLLLCDHWNGKSEISYHKLFLVFFKRVLIDLATSHSKATGLASVQKKFFFFNLCFGLLSNIAKKFNQIRNNVVCVLVRLVFMVCCAVTTGRCNAFQHIVVNQKKSEFYDPYFQTMLFLVTMEGTSKLWIPLPSFGGT